MTTETRLPPRGAPINEGHGVSGRNPGPPPILHLGQRTAALQALGWSERDAEWLALVCLHSGVCTRGQYVARFEERPPPLSVKSAARFRPAGCGPNSAFGVAPVAACRRQYVPAGRLPTRPLPGASPHTASSPCKRAATNPRPDSISRNLVPSPRSPRYLNPVSRRQHLRRIEMSTSAIPQCPLFEFRRQKKRHISEVHVSFPVICYRQLAGHSLRRQR